MADLSIDLPEPPTENVMLVPTAVSTSQVPAISTSSSRVSTILNPFDLRQPLLDSQRDPLYLAAPQTWAQLNPSLGVQKQRMRAKPTDAAKATRKITTARNKANAELLTADIEKQIQLQQTQIQQIADDHGRKFADIEKLINHRTNYRQSCGPSLSNALIHKKGVEMNEGIPFQLVHFGLILMHFADRETGDRASLAEIRQAMGDDPLYQNISEPERKEAIDELVAY